MSEALYVPHFISYGLSVHIFFLPYVLNNFLYFCSDQVVELANMVDMKDKKELKQAKEDYCTRYGIKPNTLDQILGRKRKRTGTTTPTIGRPPKVGDLKAIEQKVHSSVNSLMIMLCDQVHAANTAQRSLRSGAKGPGSFAQTVNEQAKKEALTRGQPAHSVTISRRTLARIKAQLKENKTTEVTPQLKTDVRTQAEDSIRALASLYALSNATMRDVHPELITNTDQTQYHYNIDVEKLTKVLLFRGDDPSCLAEVKEQPSRALKVTARKKGAKQETATVTGKFNQHLPQRIFATMSCNSLGATSPVMFSKPIASLGSQQIVKIKFRALSTYPGTGPDHQAQLWLYDPEFVTKEQIWTGYYTEIYVPFLRRLYASVSPTITN